MTMESPIDVSIREGIAVVTLNEPKVNAQTVELMESLTAAFDQFNDTARRQQRRADSLTRS